VPASVVVHTDIDGDRVTFKSSLGNLNRLIFNGADPVGANHVYSVELTDSSFNGTNFTVSVAKSKTGDGQAIIGHINARNNNLGVVTIGADLGDIDAGSGSDSIPAIKSLTVNSFGRYGQRGTGGDHAQINGNVGTLVVKRDLIEVNFDVIGNLNTVRVGGSVIGGDNHGQIYAHGRLNKVTIKGDIRGGDGLYTGTVGANQDVGSVIVGGSIYGGKGNYSGRVFAAINQSATIGMVRVGGSVIGGQGESSGAIGGRNTAIAPGMVVSFGTVFIGKDIVGGSGQLSGSVVAYFGNLDRLTVRGSVIGGSGMSSGLIYSGDTAERIVIWGNIIGGSFDDAGHVGGLGGVEFLSIRGDVRGGSGIRSGIVKFVGPGITTKLIGGAVIPGSGADSGEVIG
jgi:hypothetical protein